MTCIRYLGMSFDEIYKLTVREYLIILEALKLRLTDEDYRAHEVAWLSFAASSKTGTRKHQKPKYDTFKKFYNYDAALKKAGAVKKQTSNRFSRLSKHLAETQSTADKEVEDGR